LPLSYSQIISSVLELESGQLAKIAMDPKGSHVLDSLFTSGTVGDKNKDKVVQKLKV
jgi:hypothetical protein